MKRIVSLLLTLVLVVSVICALPVSSNAAVLADSRMRIVDEDNCLVDSSAFVSDDVSLTWTCEDDVKFYVVYCRVFQDYGKGYNTGWVSVSPRIDNVSGNDSMHASVPIKDRMMAGIACKNDVSNQDVTVDFCIIGVLDDSLKLEGSYASDELVPSTGMLYPNSESFVPSLTIGNDTAAGDITTVISVPSSASAFKFNITRPYNYFSESAIVSYWFFAADRRGDWAPLYGFKADANGNVLNATIPLDEFEDYVDSNNSVRVTVRALSYSDFVTPYYGGVNGGYTLRIV